MDAQIGDRMEGASHGIPTPQAVHASSYVCRGVEQMQQTDGPLIFIVEDDSAMRDALQL
jgi:hypothetical protein